MRPQTLLPLLLASFPAVSLANTNPNSLTAVFGVQTPGCSPCLASIYFNCAKTSALSSQEFAACICSTGVSAVWDCIGGRGGGGSGGRKTMKSVPRSNGRKGRTGTDDMENKFSSSSPSSSASGFSYPGRIDIPEAGSGNSGSNSDSPFFSSSSSTSPSVSSNSDSGLDATAPEAEQEPACSTRTAKEKIASSLPGWCWANYHALQQEVCSSGAKVKGVDQAQVDAVCASL